MEKVKAFLQSFPRGGRTAWSLANGMSPNVVAQIATGHKGVGLEYAMKMIAGSKGKLKLADFGANK